MKYLPRRSRLILCFFVLNFVFNSLTVKSLETLPVYRLLHSEQVSSSTGKTFIRGTTSASVPSSQTKTYFECAEYLKQSPKTPTDPNQDTNIENETEEEIPHSEQEEFAKCFKGTVAVFPLFSLLEFDISTLSEGGSCKGILIVLPRDLLTTKTKEFVTFQNEEERESKEEIIKKLGKIESLLIEKEFRVPIYFINEDEVSHLFSFDSLHSDKQGNYNLKIAGKPGNKKKIKQVSSLEAWLPTDLDEEGKLKPTIVITANYDTFSISPALSSGLESGNNAVGVLIELSRLFTKLYNNPQTKGQYNLLFVLNGGSKQNYLGTKKWISSVDRKVLESVELVLCLDSLSIYDDDLVKNQLIDDLFLHYSNGGKIEIDKAVPIEFQSISKMFGINTQIVTKKIMKNNPLISFEHEIFYRKKLKAITISNFKSYNQTIRKGSLLDLQSGDNPTARPMKTVTTLIAEFLSKMIYKQQQQQSQFISIFENNYEPNNLVIQNINKMLLKYNRFSPFLEKDEQLLLNLENTFKSFGLDTKIESKKISLKKETFYYTGTQAKLTIFKVKSLLFEFFVFILSLVYLAVLYYFLNGKEKTIQEIKQLINNRKKNN
ncbi:nicalin [Anaeramoeba flamelloides]|uniref:Nicalin n=1 Tax=Anaeramoeba flamelloides TaxID=1746091 RepID=A0ABQ8XJV4_9EUKA|nr:nicalin [Anaeramoeba flamelloides]